MYVVQITSGLKFTVAESDQRSVGFLVALLFHEPSWRFGYEVDEHKRECGDESTSKLIPPRVVSSEFQADDIGGVTQD